MRNEGRKEREEEDVEGGGQGVELWGGGGGPGRGPTSRHFRFYRRISGHGVISLLLQDPTSAYISRSSS